MSKSFNPSRFMFILFSLALIAVGAIAIVVMVFRQSDYLTDRSQSAHHITEEEMPRNVQQFRSTIESLIRDGQYEQATDVLRRMDVSMLVNQAVQANDLRWMAIYEDDLVLPGLDETARITARGDEYWVIPGTSDVLFYPSWQGAATTFAHQYNTLLQKSTTSSP